MKREAWIINDEFGNCVISNSRKNVIMLLFEEDGDGMSEISVFWDAIDWIEEESWNYDDPNDWIDAVSDRITDEELNYLGFKIEMDMVEE